VSCQAAATAAFERDLRRIHLPLTRLVEPCPPPSTTATATATSASDQLHPTAAALLPYLESLADFRSRPNACTALLTDLSYQPAHHHACGAVAAKLTDTFVVALDRFV